MARANLGIFIAFNLSEGGKGASSSSMPVMSVTLFPSLPAYKLPYSDFQIKFVHFTLNRSFVMVKM